MNTSKIVKKTYAILMKNVAFIKYNNIKYEFDTILWGTSVTER